MDSVFLWPCTPCFARLLPLLRACVPPVAVLCTPIAEDLKAYFSKFGEVEDVVSVGSCVCCLPIQAG
eukprot:scaffold27246_cov17-Tisochrysis_lutea.AAC.1